MDKKRESAKVSEVVKKMRERKREYGFSYGEIAERAGLPLGTVQKVLGGFTKSPRHETLAALERVLFPDRSILGTFENRSASVEIERTDRDAEQILKNAPLESGEDLNLNPNPNLQQKQTQYVEKTDHGNRRDTLYVRSPEQMTTGLLLGEGAPAYRIHGNEEAGKEPGQYTIRDREARREPRPSELIDGVIYDKAAPTFAHQLIAGEIYLQLQNCVRQHREPCIPFMAAADVRLDRDDKTMVMPDVFVVCDPARIVGRNGKYLDGAPDLVIEVASPSTRKTDMGLKLEKYRRAGVREYWIVDYEKGKVIVWLFGDDPDVFLYGFDAEVPVGISDGKCRIDFTEIVRQLRVVPGWETDP